MNEYNPSISKGIIQSLSKLWENPEFGDFKVTVDEDTFSCHSFILASCSEFFSGLLRSHMKEKTKMAVKLNNISSPIFRRILQTLYNGCELLTKENVLEVWSAVHQLQIQFLIEHCEDFVMINLCLDTVEMYKEYAEYLQSERVSEYIFNFMLKNFEALREKKIFLHFDFQYLKNLFQSDKLEVSSEDILLYSIFDWVKYGNSLTPKPEANEADTATAKEPIDAFLSAAQGIRLIKNTEVQNQENSRFHLNMNAASCKQSILTSLSHDELNERKKYLLPLLKSTRYFLASETCIASLFLNDKLIQSDLLVKNCLFEAFTFKFCDYFHGFWPTTAIHRDCSDVEHVGVYSDNGDIIALSFKQEKLFSIQSLQKQCVSKLTILNGKLFAILGHPYKEIYVLHLNCWMKVCVQIPDYDNQLLIAHKKSIYMFKSRINQITTFNPLAYPINVETLKLELVNPTHALSFHNYIVVFSPEDNNGEEETAVHSWDTETNVWTKLDNLNFSSQNMTSFRSDSDTYILDSNGNLWKLTNSEIIEITCMAKLWSAKYDVKGVSLFRETLHIICDSLEDLKLLDKFEGVYTSTKFWKETRNISNFVQYVIPKNELLPANPKTT